MKPSQISLSEEEKSELESWPDQDPFADVLVGQGGLAAAQFGDPVERERSRVLALEEEQHI